MGSICTPRVLSIGHQTWVVTGKRQQSEENVGTCDRSMAFNPRRQIPDFHILFARYKELTSTSLFQPCNKVQS